MAPLVEFHVPICVKESQVESASLGAEVVVKSAEHYEAEKMKLKETDNMTKTLERFSSSEAKEET